MTTDFDIHLLMESAALFHGLRIGGSLELPQKITFALRSASVVKADEVGIPPTRRGYTAS